MRRFYFILFMCSLAHGCWSQVQQGYVKTKGRLGNNGVVVKGSRLSGATITVKGRNAVVSGANGSFTLTLLSNNYFLQSVQKHGYVLTDPDVLSKQYAYSKNPLVLVLEIPSQQADDRLAAERKIRRTLQRQLQEREDEIESLKEQKRLSEEEYRKQLQELYAQQESNDKLISEMADRYSKMDFDEIDEFNRRISSLILEGRLTEADSLLNTKGNIDSRTVSLRLHQEANALERQEVSRRQKRLAKSEALAQQELEDLARDCYSKYEIFKMQYQNDSAAHYIAIRANLDTTNIDWQVDAGLMYDVYMSDFPTAAPYFECALRQAILQADERKTAVIYRNLGSVYNEWGHYDQALECHQQALSLFTKLFGTEYYEVGNTYYSMANVYEQKGDYPKSLEYSQKCKEILATSPAAPAEDIAKNYNQLGAICNKMRNFPKAEKYLLQAKTMMDSIADMRQEWKVDVYTNLGVLYKNLHDFDQAMQYYQQALDVYLQVYGDKHQATATVYVDMGSAMLEKGDYAKAIYYENKALDICIPLLGPQHPFVGGIYVNLAGCYGYQGDYDKGLEYYRKAHDLFLPLLGAEHPYMAIVYQGLGSLLDEKGQYAESLEYLEKAVSIHIKTYGEDYPYRKEVEKGIEDIKAKMKKQKN